MSLRPTIGTRRCDIDPLADSETVACEAASGPKRWLCWNGELLVEKILSAPAADP